MKAQCKGDDSRNVKAEELKNIPADPNDHLSMFINVLLYVTQYLLQHIIKIREDEAIVVIVGDTWIYIPVLGSFPSSNVKLNHAVNITIAPRCAPDMCSVELFENLGRMICREDTNIVNISKILARDLEKSKL